MVESDNSILFYVNGQPFYSRKRKEERRESLWPEIGHEVEGEFPGWAFGFRVGGMVLRPPVVLTIAGFDPCSGAGITADIKTIAAHDCYGVCCVTALTVQSTQGVRRVEGVDPTIIHESLQELASDLEIEAVHIGMLGNEQAVNAVARFLDKSKLPHVVLDPILKSSSGTDLLDAAGTRLMIEKLVPLAEVVTPNLNEASALTGIAVTNLDEMRKAAARLHSLGAANVVVTGGHLDKAIDLLSFSTRRGTEQEVFKADRQRSNSTHGTGCAFATALACHLAQGRGLPEAVLLSKAYVVAAIANAHPLGRGIGPVHHLYRMNLQRRRSAVVADEERAHSRG
ncbi:MAG TPA: bifunctional hydroxymethylpyrimidine kinase/phosphomethylpyrimidine kinase [Terriglobales bacterium]|nr:bifunctional hydroxymethylpyrimidine kinase/phosphomethylpyrimidine kinase [Terriglobales bacterium]